MKTLTIKNKFQTNATLISNDFIDHAMIPANGEFVKVYLFLLRHLDDPCSELSVSSIADCLNHTESDILRAFRYWESQGLLALDTDESGNVTGICLEKNPSLSAPAGAPDAGSPAPAADTPVPGPGPLPAKAIPLDSFKAQKDLKNLYFIAEQYLGKTLTATDIETITCFYETFGLSADVIEYLLGSCVENGHKSLHYIKKVALSWSKAGISSVEEARRFSAAYHKNSYTVLNAFGIKGRAPAAAELSYIEKWFKEYGFSDEIVTEACSRTISVTHQPSFEYTDKILKKWLDSGVRRLQDVQALDQAFREAKAEKRSRSSRSAQKNLNNFERRSYDMDSLEEKLLNSN